MKKRIWTEEKIKEVAKSYPSPGKLKEALPVAYKAARQLGLLAEIYPPNERKRHVGYTEADLRSIAAKSLGRADMQATNPSAYNAARRLNLVDSMFPPAKNTKKWDSVTLKAEASKYTTRSDFYNNSPGAHSVACKLGVLDDLGLPVLQGTSVAEKEILEFLRSLQADFKSKRFHNDYELDCYSDTLKLGVEYNGLYWHSEEAGKTSTYHLKKTKYFEERGIRVIHIWEHEWRDRKLQVQNYLSSACRANTVRVGARKCDFVAIDPGVARAFMDTYHIQGQPGIIQLALGCFYQGSLVAVATFGPHHRLTLAPEKVLNRFACVSGTTVAGCLAKMTKMAFVQLGPLKSWADYCKSQAGGYLAAGWVMETTLKPDYFYATPQGKLVSKQSRRKSVVNTPQNMTEREHATKDGLYRVWDCGKIVLTFKG